MKIPAPVVALVALALVAGVAAHSETGLPAHSALSTSDATPFTLDEHGAVVIAASINDAGLFRLMIDTGSNRSIVSGKTAEALGLVPVAQSEILTAAGRAIAPVARLDVINFGPVVRTNLLALILPTDRLAQVAPGVDGVIGQDLLLHLDYTIDYRHKTLVWTPPDRSSAPSQRLKLVTEEGRYLVELPQSQSSDAPRLLRLVPDSSASNVVLYRRRDDSLGLQPTSLRADVASITGRRDARLMLIPDLQVGTISLLNRYAIVIDRPSSEETRADGVLPLHIFASVTFSGRDAFLVAK